MRGKDFTGLKYGRLTAVCRTDRKTPSRSWIWKFKCECGGETEARIADVKRGSTQSCGCLQKEKTSKAKLIHGKEGTRIYRIWGHMKSRCTNENNKRYKDYGGRGITVCQEWMNFKNFYDWAIKNGYKDNLTIDRIDNEKGYNPSNCRWATMREQQSNRRNTRVIEINGKKMTMRELSELTGISLSVIRNRRQRNKPILTKQQYDALCKRMEKKGA